MTDIIDQAHEAEERDRALAFRRLRAATAYCESQVWLPDGQGHMEVVCRDCGTPVQPERLRASPNACRCIDCQLAQERDHALEKRLYG